MVGVRVRVGIGVRFRDVAWARVIFRAGLGLGFRLGLGVGFWFVLGQGWVEIWVGAGVRFD